MAKNERPFRSPSEVSCITTLQFADTSGSLREAFQVIPLAAYHGNPRGPVIKEPDFDDTDPNAIAVLATLVDEAQTYADLPVRRKFELVLAAYFVAHDNAETRETFHIEKSTMNTVRHTRPSEDPRFQERAEALSALIPFAEVLQTHNNHPLRDVETYAWLKQKLENPDNDLKYYSHLVEELSDEFLTDRERATRGVERLNMIERRLRGTSNRLSDLGLLAPELTDRDQVREQALRRLIQTNLAKARAAGVKPTFEMLSAGTDLTHMHSLTPYLEDVKADTYELQRGLKPVTMELLDSISVILDKIASPDDMTRRSQVSFARIQEELTALGYSYTQEYIGSLCGEHLERLKLQPRRSKNLGEADIARIRQMRADRWKLTDIAAELGVSLSTVKNYLRQSENEA